MPQLSVHSAVGDLTISEEDGSIVALDWGWGRDQSPTPLLRQAAQQIHAYFDRALTRFDLPLRPGGSAYRRRVWQALCNIPYGETVTYGRIAALAGGSARSAGQAIGANPIPVIIPCHRVLGSNGIGGYSGGDGLDTKRRLLTWEAAGPSLPASGRALRPRSAHHGARV